MALRSSMKTAEKRLMRNLPWFNHFNALLEGFEAQKRTESPDYPLLVQAIKEKYIPEADYFLWAKNHYELPVLNPEFFDTVTSTNFWFTYKTAYPWTSYLLPVGEWDRHLLVACLEKPESFPENLKPIFVLCSPSALEDFWSKINPVGDKTVFISADARAKALLEMTNLEAVPKTNEIQDQIIMADSLEVAATTDFDVSTEQAIALENPIPEGLTEPQESEKIKIPSLADLDLIKPSDAIPDVTLVAAVIPPTTTADAPATPAFELTLVETPAPASAATTKQLILDLLFQKNKPQFIEEIQGIFEKMKSHFPKSMVLSLDAEESAFKPYQWTNEFKSESENTQFVDLTNPSLFKIVSVSQKSYHGFIVLNEVNERFFEEWNQGALPDHATATPILINNKLAGILIGIGEKSNYSWATLNLMENLTSELNQKLSQLVDSAA
jgi:hypothetical protein